MSGELDLATAPAFIEQLAGRDGCRILEMSGVDKMVALYEDFEAWQRAQGSGPVTDGTRP